MGRFGILSGVGLFLTRAGYGNIETPANKKSPAPAAIDNAEIESIVAG
jgi:hypothetical protein